MRYTLLCLIAVTLLVAGCKKKNDGPAIPKIATSIIPNIMEATIDTSDYTYNGEGKVTQILNRNGVKQAFTYTGNIVSQVYYDKNGVITRTVTWFINSDGLADSSIEAFSGSTAYYYSYKYDDKKFIILRKFYNPSNALSSVTNYSNDGSNITNEYAGDGSGSISSTITYTFFTDKNNSLENENFGMPYLGKRYANPLKVQNVTGSLNYLNSYTYTYDGDGKITSASAYSGTGSLNYTNEYIYE